MLADDERLLIAIRAGETDRFAELVARHDRCVRGVVERAVRDPLLREELVQETFALAFRGIAELAAPDKLEAWLASIARHAVVDALRRQGRRERAREIPLDDLDVAGREPSGGWIWEEVAQLGEADREALVLRYRDGLSYREIALRLRVPDSTVRGRIYEARRALRRRLELQDREIGP